MCDSETPGRAALVVVPERFAGFPAAVKAGAHGL